MVAIIFNLDKIKKKVKVDKFISTYVKLVKNVDESLKKIHFNEC